MLQVKRLRCGYESGATVIRDLSLRLARGEIGALLGPSGCGKTTLLKALAGFQTVWGGTIDLRGTRVAGPRQHVPPERRRIGVVFQDYALFPHLTVQDNIAFGLPRGSRQDSTTVSELLGLTELTAQAKAYPHEISGGQQQRVALARALAPNPDLLLLDEPFSNLDAEMRGQLARAVKRILRSRQATALLVTHDQTEAFAVADQVGVLHDGRLEQWDTPYKLYHEPATRFVANFIGKGVFIRGIMTNQHTATTILGTFRGAVPGEIAPGDEVDVLVRPDDVVFDSESLVQATVEERIFAGATQLYRMQLRDGSQFEMVASSHHLLEPGTTTGVRLAAEHLIAFPSGIPANSLP